MVAPPPLLKINFRSLYRRFKKKVVAHFLLTVIWTFWSIVLFGVITELFRKESLSAKYNYSQILIPEKFREQSWVSKIDIPLPLFIIIGLLLVIGYALLYYLNSLWEEELRVKGGHYAENLILDKFRRLTFEEKQLQKDKVNKLVESDCWEVGHYWEHLPNHIFHNGLKIVGLLFFYFGHIKQMTPRAIVFSLFWLGLLNLVIYFFAKKVLRNEEKYKKRLDHEWAIVNKERSNIILIESMGLTSQYRTRQREVKKANEKLCLKFSRTKSLSKTIPNNLLMEFFPFLLLGLNWSSFNGKILIVFWWIFNELASIFQCLWEYANYVSSRERINSFLDLPEKDDHLNKPKLSLKFPITTLHFENVSFRYQGQKEWLLKNYNQTFSVGQINYLLGKNGTGKSTKLYLLLGEVEPQVGKITVELANKQTYELHKDINLAAWRTNNAAYCSHETLIEKGSTGQKQLANLQQVLKERETSQIFCFDEADNALDVKNQAEFQEKLQGLVKKGKLVIYIKH